MTKFIQKKELDGMEELWVHPFRHLQFYYATPDKTYNVKEFIFNPEVWLHKTVFTDVSEAVMHVVQQMGGIPPHDGGKIHLYRVLPIKPIKRYKMTLLDPQDDLSMACELYEAVTFEFNATLIIENIMWSNGRISDVHYRAELSKENVIHKYSESKRGGFKEPYDTYDTLKIRQPKVKVVYEESPLSEYMMKEYLKNATPQTIMDASITATNEINLSKKVSPARVEMLKESDRIYKDGIEAIGSSHLFRSPSYEFQPTLKNDNNDSEVKMLLIKNRNEKGEN